MGKNTKIVATVIPKKFDGKKLDISIAFTPRLPDTGMLGEYFEVWQWFDYLKFFKSDQVPFNLYRPATAPSPIEGNHINPPNAAQAKSLWTAMFTRESPVNGWIINSLSYELTDQITHNAITEEIRKGINESINEILAAGNFSNRKDPFTYDNRQDLRRQELASFAEYLEGLKKKDINLILNDPVLTNTRYRPLLQKLYRKMQGIKDAARRVFEDLSLRLSVSEIEKRNFEETNEFHKRFSAYGNHPYLLQETGWILDYSVEVPGRFNGSWFIGVRPDLGLLHNEADIAPADLQSYLAFKQEIEFIYPITALSLTPNNAILVDAYRSENLLKVDDRNGYVILDTNANYRVQANLVDKAQILARIETLLNTNYEFINSKFPVDKRNNVETLATEKEHLSAELTRGSQGQEYITCGIAIAIKNLKRVLEESVKKDPSSIQKENSALAKTEGTGVIFRHNLLAGYRVDIASLNPLIHTSLATGSLCDKKEIFIVNRSTRIIFPRNPNTVSEGMILESTQGSNSGKLYVDEELFRFNDASLISGSHGDHTGINKADLLSELQIQVLPGDRSLVPLRFGRKYSFAIRTADIIGYGQIPVNVNAVFTAEDLARYLSDNPSDDVKSRLGPYWTEPIYYQRVESVNSPLLFLGNKIFNADQVKLDVNDAIVDEDLEATSHSLPDWKPERWGDDIATMVIRSFYDPGKRALKFTTGEAAISTRFLAPPRANWNFVVQHGYFDKFFGEIQQDFTIGTTLTSAQQSKLEKIKNSFLKPAEVKLNSDIHTILSDKVINFMHDPLVEGFEWAINNVLKTVGLPQASPPGNFEGIILPDETVATGKYDHHKYWLYSRYYKVQLRNTAATEGFEYAVLDQQPAVFGLRKGFEKDVQIACALGETSLATSTPVERLFLPGVPLKRRTHIRLVHAVQKPCLITTARYANASDPHFLNEIPVKTSFTVHNRVPGGSSATVNVQFDSFPVLTADSYILHVQYFEWICNRYKPDGYEIKHVTRVAQSGFMPAQQSLETNVAFEDIDHVFNDTRFRHAQYKIEAVSKFRKYFHPGLAKEGFSVTGLDNKTAYFSDTDIKKETWTLADYRRMVSGWPEVLNTKQPDAPVIDRIVPLIHWDENNPDRIIRKCDTVRIYFQGDWYSTGPGEKLAVLFMQHATFDSANVLDPVPGNEVCLDNIISQFGKDPISTQVNFGDTSDVLRLDQNCFDTSCVSCNPLSGTIPIERLDFAKPDLSGYSNLLVNGVVYDIRFSPPQTQAAEFIEVNNAGELAEVNEIRPGQFYVDIKLKDEISGKYLLLNKYFPFVRFAIARYQEKTINDIQGPLDLRFSRVVVTDFVQLLPYREIRGLKSGNPKFYAPARRGINYKKEDNDGIHTFDYNVENHLYVLGETNKDLPAMLFDADYDDSSSGIAIRSDETPIRKIDKGQLAIMEYESYANPDSGGNPVGPDEADPRKNHTRRLVFSYIPATEVSKQEQNEKTN